MYLANELDVNGRLLRGNVRMPDAGGPFPTIVFLHGFTVWKTGPQRLYEEFVRMAVKEGSASCATTSTERARAKASSMK